MAGLPPQSADTTFAHREAADNTSAHRSLWGADPHGMQVEFIRVENGGHGEPSIRRRPQWMYSSLLGAQNGDFELAEEAWRFFRDKRSASP